MASRRLSFVFPISSVVLMLVGASAPWACSSENAPPGTNSTTGGTQTSTSGGAGSGGSTGTAGGDIGAGGGPGAGGTGAAGSVTGTAGSAGAAGGGGVGGGGGSAGASGTAGAGGSATGGGAGAGGAAGSSGGAGGSGGGKSCAGNAVSLSANGTATDPDTARARVEADLMTDLPIGNATRTVEFWAFIKPTDWLGERNEVYVYGSPGTTATAFGLDFGTNPVSGTTNHATLNPYTNGGFNDDSAVDLGITSAASQWVHIAMTYDGTAVRTYVNGALKITTNGTNGITMLATASTPLTMGCNPPIFNCFNGYFDDLRVWKVARSAMQIMDNYTKTLAGNEADLVGYWKFDEAPGVTTAADSVTTAGHTPHPGVLMATNANQRPRFITPNPPAPILCP
jgi:hypothetical protein